MIASQQYVKRKEKAMMKTEALNLTQEWDKTFPKSDKVDHCKVMFANRYGITLGRICISPRTLTVSCLPSPSAGLSAR